ncbi:two component transcriptional regulator, LytTR family [Filimonas lacunae]|uniref:Two component transcriptional regulator, LytTR family n=1 Tax=Filimonas lacunae TaxID=477680 RepID=A0A173MR87_9BACT|nr:LytTR family DNA-binding domain-containing protein [Filimonas lacunae]BAV09891.1 two-component system response regulator [Filimonas lacunae]SIS80582.1 two component transcriptional regulator, LytTR family [Filimonas lacunae]
MINSVIIDDEPLAAGILQDYIEKVPFLNLKATFTNALEAIQYIEQEDVDLLFLDIRMPDITGVDLLKNLKKRPAAIFTTAYQEYAIEGYSLNVVDYLLKPIPFTRFVSAATKAYDYINMVKSSRSGGYAAQQEFIFIKTEYKIVKVDLSDILYIEGLKDYSKIYLKDNSKPIFTLQNLKSFESKLPQDRFIRIHRSYIVSINKINVICKNRVMIAQTDIPVSIGFKNNLQEIIFRNS